MTIFCKAKKEVADHLKFILYLYELASGLKINFEKSQLVGIGLQQVAKKGYANLMGCKMINLPTKYLGYPLHWKKLRVADWSFLEKKIDKQLAGWKSKALTIVGKLMLINVIIGTIPTY